MFGDKISCVIMGGLGNQLFQVFTIIALSNKTKRIIPCLPKIYMNQNQNLNKITSNEPRS